MDAETFLGQDDKKPQPPTMTADAFLDAPDKTDLARSAIIVHNINPDKQAENNKKAQEKGIPVALATPATGPVDADKMNSKIKDFQNRGGATAAILSDPKKAAVVHDDTDNMSIFEESGKLATSYLRVGIASMTNWTLSPFSAWIGMVHGLAPGKDFLDTAYNDLTGMQKGIDDAWLTPEDKKPSDVFNTAMVWPLKKGGELLKHSVRQIPSIMAGDMGAQIELPETILDPIAETIGQFLAMLLVGKLIDVASGSTKGLVEAGKQLKVFKRAPELGKEFVEKATERNPGIQIPVSTLEEVLGKAGKKIDDLSDPRAVYQDKFFFPQGKATISPVDIASNAEHISGEHIKAMNVEGLPSENEQVEYSKQLIQTAAQDPDVSLQTEKKPDGSEVHFLTDKKGNKVPLTDEQADHFNQLKEDTKGTDTKGTDTKEGVSRPGQEAPAKEPWQMTQEEFIKSGKHDELVHNFVRAREQYENDVLQFGENSPETKASREVMDKLDNERAGRLPEDAHRTLVDRAIKQGKPVPPEVLKDYPELARNEEATGQGIVEARKSQTEQTEQAKAGPGAQTANSPSKETPSDIAQLTESIPKGERKQTFAKDALADALETIQTVKNATKKAFITMADVGQRIWDNWRKPKIWTQFKDILGNYDLEMQKAGREAAKFTKKIVLEIPDEIQEGISNWIEANGDESLLKDRAAKSGKRVKKGYEAASNLSPEHKLLAENIKNYFLSRLHQAIAAGVVDHGVKNFVHRIWDRDSSVGVKIAAEANAGMFQLNPSLAKQRVFETFFEGEQAGAIPKDKRIGYVLTAYDLSLNEAIAGRGLIKGMLEGKASDGRPLVDISGSGKQIPGEGIPDSYIIRPKTKPSESLDYRASGHPSMQKWKWVGRDAQGKPIFMQGDLLFHPEIYRHMKNILGESAIREFQVWGYRPGQALLSGIQMLKSTLLSLSMFHQVQEGVHAVGHTVNPFKTKEIDLNDPLTADLVKHGVLVYNSNAMMDFAEGVHAGGLVSRIPVIGRQMKAYGEYLFQGYIPRLKMEMARKAYARNTKRYAGKLNRDQILELTARQANAAFGELNYMQMGRNKTIQDMFRLVALAPDFLEARAKFVGQAFTPYGREQMAALVRLAAYQSLIAQTTNLLVNGEMDWSQPFSVKINGTYYTLRSVPGDIMHLITDWRSFSYNRLNPTLTKPMVEALTGRDQFGQKKEIWSQMADWVTGQAPIPIQGPLQKSDVSLLASVLKSAGVSSRKAYSPAYTKLNEFLRDQLPVGGQTPEEKEMGKAKTKIKEELRDGGSMKHLPEKLQQYADKMTNEQKKALEKEAELSPMQASFKKLEDPNLTKSIKVWAKATDDERDELAAMYKERIDKYYNDHPELTAEEIDKLDEKIDAADERR